ncbi:MAG TPA: hypothetical protein VHV29_10315 [Terriglobales bacterium]|jgi:hypothetical protein|nr:hypothetical protein [Terriglobales bacterium]
MNRETDNAIRSAFGSLKVRPNDQVFSSSQVVERLKANHGVEVTTVEGILELKQNGQIVSVPTVLRAFASKPENAGLFVSEGDDHTKWDGKKKTEFIAQHGIAAWESKIAKAPLKANVDVANCDISKTEYLSMTMTEKARWIGMHGLDSQAAVLRKAK